MHSSVDFVNRVGPGAILDHNRALIDYLFDRLPDRFVPTSPRDRFQRGPFGCFAGRTAAETRALYDRLVEERVIVSLRQGSLRISPHLYNTEDDIARLVAVARG
jgi:selenocysteine lyase/cysteine desulfurase